MAAISVRDFLVPAGKEGEAVRCGLAPAPIFAVFDKVGVSTWVSRAPICSGMLIVKNIQRDLFHVKYNPHFCEGAWWKSSPIFKTQMHLQETQH